MSKVGWGAAGVCLAVVWVLGAGILEIQRIYVRGGVRVGLDNVPDRVVRPQLVPWPPVLAAVLLGAAVLLLLLVAARMLGSGDRLALAGGFAVSVLVLVAWSYTVWPENPDDLPMRLGFARGWRGWVQAAGENPAVHLLGVLALAIPLPWWYRPPGQEPAAVTDAPGPPEPPGPLPPTAERLDL